MSERLVKELIIPNNTKYLAEVRQAVRHVVKGSSFQDRDMHRIVLAVDEAVSNIMEHAYEAGDDESQLTIDMLLSSDSSKFEVTIRDSGKVFSPTGLEIPDMQEHIAAGRRNGLGVFLMRQIMDEVKYTFVHGFINELYMVKYVRTAIGEAYGRNRPNV